MYIKFDELGKAISFSEAKNLSDIMPSSEDFEYYNGYFLLEDRKYVRKVHGEVEIDDAAKCQDKHQKEIEGLRSRRASECFSVIDRSILWHNRLTEEQKTELNVWYQAWLNVTETKVIPEKPAWLEEK